MHRLCRIAWLCAAMALVACGGGGGGDDPPTTAPPPSGPPPAPPPPAPPPGPQPITGTLSLVAGHLGPEPDCPVDGALASARFTGIGGLASDATGRLYLTDNAPDCTDATRPLGSSSLRAIDLAAGTVSTRTSFRRHRAEGSTAQTGLWAGLAIGADGSGVVVGSDDGFVVGSPIWFGGVHVLAPDGSQQSFPGSAYSVAITSAGETYLDCDGVCRFNGAQGSIRRVIRDPQTGAEIPGIRAVAVGPDDGLYFATDGAVYRESSPGVAALLAGGDARGVSQDGSGIVDGVGRSASFGSIAPALAVDAEGNVLVVDSGHTLRRISPQGEVRTIAGAPGQTASVEPGALPGKLSSARALTVTRDGRIFVQAGAAVLEVKLDN